MKLPKENENRHMISLSPDVYRQLLMEKIELEDKLGMTISFGQFLSYMVKRVKEANNE